MSMVEQFFSVDYAGRSDLFEEMKLWDDEKYHSLQGKFPVISLSFAGVKGTGDFSQMRKMICRLIYEQYDKYKFLLHVDRLMSEKEKELFNEVSWEMEDSIADRKSVV